MWHCITYKSRHCCYSSPKGRRARPFSKGKEGYGLDPPFLEWMYITIGQSHSDRLYWKTISLIFIHLPPDPAQSSYTNIQSDHHLNHLLRNNMSSQHRSSDETSIKTNSSPYIVLKTDTPVSHFHCSGQSWWQAKKWTPEENDRFLDMIDNRVIGDTWSVKGEEKKVVNRPSGEKKPWTAIVCPSKNRGIGADVFSSRKAPNRNSVLAGLLISVCERY